MLDINTMSELILHDFIRLNDKFSREVSMSLAETFPEKRAFILLFTTLLQKEWESYMDKN